MGVMEGVPIHVSFSAGEGISLEKPFFCPVFLLHVRPLPLDNCVVMEGLL